MKRIEEIAGDVGFSECGYVKTGDLRFYPEVRRICEGNSCRSYGATWACPPAVGTLEECRERVSHYDKFLLLSKVYSLEDSFDFEGMVAGLQHFRELTDRFHRAIEGKGLEFLLLSNEGCGRCSRCTYPAEPCRFPQLLHHSLEGYGFHVSELAQAAGMRYNNGANQVTFFGALLYREQKKETVRENDAPVF